MSKHKNDSQRRHVSASVDFDRAHTIDNLRFLFVPAFEINRKNVELVHEAPDARKPHGRERGDALHDMWYGAHNAGAMVNREEQPNILPFARRSFMKIRKRSLVIWESVRRKLTPSSFNPALLYISLRSSFRSLTPYVAEMTICLFACQIRVTA